MIPRRVRVRPSPGMSLFGGIFGLIFVGIGFFVVIPNAGLFGVFWTLTAIGITVTNFYNALSRRGIATEIIEVDESQGTQDIESRIQHLDQLRAKGLITAPEHEQRKAEILREI